MTSELSTTLITSSFTLLTAGLAAWQAIKLKKLDKALEAEKNIKLEKEKVIVIKQEETDVLDYKLKALSYLLEFETFTNLVKALDDIFQETSVDRFLILYGINGSTVMKSVSAIFQYEKKTETDAKWRFDAIGKYKDLEIDEYYKNMLLEIEEKGHTYITTEELPKYAILKFFYEKEGVTSSIVKFFFRKNLSENRDMILYCSFGTHDKNKLSESDLVYIKTKFNLVKNTVNELLK